MATANHKQQCSMCDKENVTSYCIECEKSFCFSHLIEHRNKIEQDFHGIEHNFNLFQDNINYKKTHSNQHLSINKINQWENVLIEKIRLTAEECRQKLNEYIIEIENKFEDLSKQLRKMSKDKEFNEIDLQQLRNKLNKLQDELDTSSYVSVEQNISSEFINKLYIVISTIDESFYLDTKWKQNAITIAGGNGEGNQLDQINYPRGICIDDNQTIYIADYWNHRIMEWKANATMGRIVAGGNEQGNQMDQLSRPTDVLFDKKNNSLIISDRGNSRVMEWSLQNNINSGRVIIPKIKCWGLAIDKNGEIYVSNYERDEVRRWKRGETEGTLVAGGNGHGNQLNQLNSPSYIFVDNDLSLYVSDRDNHRIMKWLKDANEGIVVAGGNGQGDSLTQLYYPRGLTVDQLGHIYVADFGNHRVMRWCEGNQQGNIVVGGNRKGNRSDQFNGPIGLVFDQQRNLYVSDEWNHRVLKFEIG